MLWEHILEHKNEFTLIDKAPFCLTLRILLSILKDTLLNCIKRARSNWKKCILVNPGAVSRVERKGATKVFQFFRRAFSLDPTD